MRIIRMIRYSSGVGRHAWYETNLGFDVKKPIIDILGVDEISWWNKIWLWIKKIVTLFKNR